MQFINKRHLDIPIKTLSAALLGFSLVLLVIGLFSTSGPSKEESSELYDAVTLDALERTLLKSPPEDYAAALDNWRRALKPTRLAGVVLEGPRGEVIAGSGSFLDQNGRYYSTVSGDIESRNQAILETSVTDMSPALAKEPPYPTRVRVYSFTGSASSD